MDALRLPIRSLRKDRCAPHTSHHLLCIAPFVFVLRSVWVRWPSGRRVERWRDSFRDALRVPNIRACQNCLIATTHFLPLSYLPFKRQHCLLASSLLPIYHLLLAT